MLRELIPSDLVKIQSSNDWKRSIIAAYNQDAGTLIINFNHTFIFYSKSRKLSNFINLFR